MKKIVAIVMAVSFCSALSAAEVEKVTIKDKVNGYYENIKANLPELNRENLQIAGAAITGLVVIAGGTYAGYKYFKKK